MTAFRRDINGLRAWAVAAVVLFHFGVPGFDGGFIGVDVFFVISGFLMTGILFNRLLQPAPGDASYTLGDFYLARARRILPALLVLCAVLLLLGWFFLPALDYRTLSIHVLSSVLFVSNIRFMREAGYFDIASHDKLLLHTWTLSVEWQFYLLFPLLLLLLWKLWPQRRRVFLVLLALCLGSFALSVYWSLRQPEAAFYLLPSRVWQMLAGSLVFLASPALRLSPGLCRGLEVAGFALILGSVFGIDSEAAWPGWRALTPVLGTVCVLLAARERSLFTSGALIDWLGKTSYSIYLWHWPVCVTLLYLELHQSLPIVVLAVAFTLVCAWLSWAYVEQPVRRHLLTLPQGRQGVLVGMVVLALLVPAGLIRVQDGVTWRHSPQVQAIHQEAFNSDPLRGDCLGTEHPAPAGCDERSGLPAAILMGDSHAESLSRALERSLPSRDGELLTWYFGDCPVIFDIHDSVLGDYGCRAFVQAAHDASDRMDTSVPLLMVSRLSYYIEGPNETRANSFKYVAQDQAPGTEAHHAALARGIVDTACAFAEQRPVYLMRPIPELKRDVPRVMGRAAMLGLEKRVSISLEEYRTRHRVAWEAQDRAAEACGVTLLDPTPYLCSEGRCWGDREGRPVYYDDDHLNERGGDLLQPLFMEMFSVLPES